MLRGCVCRCLFDEYIRHIYFHSNQQIHALNLTHMSLSFHFFKTIFVDLSQFRHSHLRNQTEAHYCVWPLKCTSQCSACCPHPLPLALEFVTSFGDYPFIKTRIATQCRRPCVPPDVDAAKTLWWRGVAVEWTCSSRRSYVTGLCSAPSSAEHSRKP